MNVNVNLRHLRYLVTLSESSTFAAAAKAAGITQSTLSAAIQGLEAEFGHPLSTARATDAAPAFGEAMVRRAGISSPKSRNCPICWPAKSCR